jgi:hypothetical protein
MKPYRDGGPSVSRLHDWTFPLPPAVGELLDVHGVDREEFQQLIRDRQPFAPMVQQRDCMLMALRYVFAMYEARDTIARA